MSTGNAPFRATKVPFRDFQAAQNIVANAEAQARDLLARARRQADGIVTRAEAHHAELTEELDTAREAHRQAQQEAELRVAKARTMTGVMREASAIRAEFETLTPWLSTLVETCIGRVIGALDDETLTAGIIARGVAELQADYALSLRVCGEDHAGILALRDAHPASFAAITAIIPDSSVAQGDVQIEGAGGLITLGSEQARTVMIACLRDALADDAAEQGEGAANPC